MTEPTKPQPDNPLGLPWHDGAGVGDVFDCHEQLAAFCVGKQAAQRAEAIVRSVNAIHRQPGLLELYRAMSAFDKLVELAEEMIELYTDSSSHEDTVKRIASMAWLADKGLELAKRGRP